MSTHLVLFFVVEICTYLCLHVFYYFDSVITYSYILETVLAKFHNSLTTTDITSDINIKPPSEVMPHGINLDISEYLYPVLLYVS